MERENFSTRNLMRGSITSCRRSALWQGSSFACGFQAPTSDVVIAGTFLTNLRACVNRRPLLIVENRLRCGFVHFNLRAHFL